MSLLVRFSTSSAVSTIQEQPKSKLHKRVRSTDSLSKSAFYDQERPVFVNGKIIKSSGISLPKISNSYLLKKNDVPIKTENGEILIDKEDDVLLCKQNYSNSKRFEIGTAQTIGRRVYMEDTAIVKGELFEGVDYIAVFDGHNGREAAVKSMEYFHSLLDCFSIKSDLFENHLSTVFEQLHEIVSLSTESGTTASVVIIRENDIIISQCGDSPVYVLTIEDKLVRIGKDHSPNDPDEAAMIIKNGGSIVDVTGVLRVNGKIAISRSIGDKALHPPMSCCPSIDVVALSSVKSVLVASDGISVVSETFIKDVLLDEFSTDIKAQCIRNNALEKDSKDNISVIIVQIQPIA